MTRLGSFSSHCHLFQVLSCTGNGQRLWVCCATCFSDLPYGLGDGPAWPSFIGNNLGFLVVFRQLSLLTCLVSKNTVHGMRKKKTLSGGQPHCHCRHVVWVFGWWEITSHKQTSWKQLFVSMHFLCYFFIATIITTKTATIATTTDAHWRPPLTKRLEL